DKGVFTIANVAPAKVTLIVSFIGYRSFFNEYDYSKSVEDENIWDISMSPGDNLLEAVTVQAAKIQIKEDTISYSIDSTMYRKNDNVEEVLKRLPGVEVDKTGKVTAQGKEVTRVKVNGKDFFGGDVTTATRELNADMVDKIQIIDDYGDQSAFTGVRDGEASKTLNIQLKKDKNKGYFGNLTAGVGTEERYIGGVSLNFFNNNRQISVIGNINNTNSSNFNFGAIGSTMGAAMGGRGGAIGGFGNTGNNDGINVSKSLGVNFRDEWGQKISAYGSYSFSDRRSTIIQNQTQDNLLSSGNIQNIQNANNYNVNINHRFQFNIEYRIDSFNYIKFTPQVNYRQTDKDNATDFVFSNVNGVKTNEGITTTISNSETPNISGTLLFNHRFKKRGRTFSLNLNAGDNRTESDEDFVNLNTIYAIPPFTDSLYQNILQDNTSENLGIRASYIEPLSKKKSLEFNYAYSQQLSGNDRQNYLVNPYTGDQAFQESLSNIFDNTYITNRFGFNYRLNEKKYNYSIGLAVQ
ncbi:MAG: outer membrane beta-barrel protein, partial [Ferruginibacter sp.]